MSFLPIIDQLVDQCYPCLVGIDLNVDPEVSDDILMGVFSPNGVHEVAQNIVEQLNGIPVGRIGKLAVYIVSIMKCKSVILVNQN